MAKEKKHLPVLVLVPMLGGIEGTPDVTRSKARKANSTFAILADMVRDAPEPEYACELRAQSTVAGEEDRYVPIARPEVTGAIIRRGRWTGLPLVYWVPDSVAAIRAPKVSAALRAAAAAAKAASALLPSGADVPTLHANDTSEDGTPHIAK